MADKEKFQAINQRLTAFDNRLMRIEAALNVRVPPASWLVARWNWALNHKGLTVVLCLVSVFGGGGFKYYLDHKDDGFNNAVDRELNKPGGISARLASLEQSTDELRTTLRTLELFLPDVIKRQFESASKLPIGTLQQRLPEVAHLVAAAETQKTKVDLKVLASLTNNLVRVSDKSEGYWPVAGDLINYRSFSIANSWSKENLPNCIDMKPETSTMVIPFLLNGKSQKVETTLASFRNCRVTLDSARDGERLSAMLLHENTSVIGFFQCLVVYHGGPIAFPIAWKDHNVSSSSGVSLSVSANTLQFSDCLFDFSISPSSSIEAKQLTKLLLAQNTPTLKIPIAG